MSERSEQRCFEIMNMNDKTFIFSPDAPNGFFQRNIFFRITQRNPRIEFIGISFPFNQGFLFFLVAANNFFNSKKYFDLFFAILLRKMIQLFFLPTGRLIYTSKDLCSIFRRQQIFPLSSSG